MWGVGVMTIVLKSLNRYVAPFFVGVCMAAASVVGDMASILALLAAGGAFGFFSLPAGGRVIARLTDGVA